ncbi:MAG: disulfide bond formation protein B [Tsuneonella sp.]
MPDLTLAPAVRLAQRLALGVPALLLGGAYLGQYAFGLYPCEMCWWQRYAHFAAVALALVSTVTPGKRGWIALAGLAILIGGLIGGYHAGVEYGWWEGFTTCTSEVERGGDPLAAIMNAPMVRCDDVQWSLFGVSLAGWNFLISVPVGLAVLFLSSRREVRP